MKKFFVITLLIFISMMASSKKMVVIDTTKKIDSVYQSEPDKQIKDLTDDMIKLDAQQPRSTSGLVDNEVNIPTYVWVCIAGVLLIVYLLTALWRGTKKYK